MLQHEWGTFMNVIVECHCSSQERVSMRVYRDGILMAKQQANTINCGAMVE